MVVGKRRRRRVRPRALAADAPIPYHLPHIDGDDLEAVAQVLRSGWLTTGREAALFEAEFQTLVQAEAAIAVSSCTAALHLALVLLELQPGDEVIVPTLTFTATAGAVLMAGLTPVLADVDPGSLLMTPESIAAKCNRRTKALLPVHYGGNPSGFLRLLAFAQQHKMRVVDDAAHALPAFVRTENGLAAIGRAGLSDATCFSFYPTKPVTTGEGGMLVVPKTVADRARRLTLHGIDADAYHRSRQAIYHYEVIEHGWKYNLPDVLATLGRRQLAKSEALWHQRVEIAGQYAAALSDLIAEERLTPPVVAPDALSAWHLYPIRLNLKALHPTWDRDRVGQRLREMGIGTSMHYRPLHRHKFWSESLGIGAQSFPVADQAYLELLSLPIWPGMSPRQVARVVERLTAVLQEGRR